MSAPVCPRCREPVALPYNASPRALVECPLCLERYPLEEALRGAPPMLRVLDDPDAGLTAVETPGEFRLAPTTGDVAAMLPARAEAAPAFDFREAAAPSLPKRPTPSSVSHRRRAPKNPLIEGVKIVGGGLVGIALAVLIMWWLLKRDSFELGPKVGRVPVLRLLVPEEFRGSEPLDQEAPTPTEPRPGADRVKAGARPAPPRRTTTRGRESVGGNAQSSPSQPSAAGVREPVENAGNPSPEPPSAVSPATEPPAAEPPPVKSSPPSPQASASPEKFLGVRDAPQVSPGEFDELLLAARQAYEQAAASDPAELEGVAAAPSDRSLYERLARLAQATTFLSGQQFGQRGREAELRKTLLQIASSADRRESLAKAAAEWLDDPSQRTSDGVVLLGQAASIARAGDLFITQLQRPDKLDATVDVFSYRDPRERFEEGDQLLVLGSIVRRPADRLAGYTGDAEEVVWGGYPIAINE